MKQRSIFPISNFSKLWIGLTPDLISFTRPQPWLPCSGDHVTSPSELFQADHMSSRLMWRSTRWKLLCLALESWYFRSSLRNWAVAVISVSLQLPSLSECAGGSPHLICLRHVHRSIIIFVHQLVNAADGLKTQESILILTEQLIYQAQTCNKVWITILKDKLCFNLIFLTEQDLTLRKKSVSLIKIHSAPGAKCINRTSEGPSVSSCHLCLGEGRRETSREEIWVLLSSMSWNIALK